MADEQETITASSERDPASHWFRFSVKSLLVVFALVAVYLGGRASRQPFWSAPQPGTWQLAMRSGHQRPVTLTQTPDGRYALGMGSNSTLGGKYRWTAGGLIVEVPDDNRYQGLVWQYEGDDLVLVSEPPGSPSGQSYVGTRLRFVSPDISPATQASVPVVPPRGALPQNPQQQAVAEGKKPPASQPWQEPTLGDWQLTMPAGAQRTVQLKKLPDGSFELVTGIALGGTYAVRNDRLEVVKPRDYRMTGLAWAWTGDALELVSEPMPPPTGSSYVGARMRPVKEGAAPQSAQ